MKTLVSTSISLVLSMILLGCGTNCREKERLGDFEFSQRNYTRAIKLYGEAWAADSLACPEAQEKLDNAQMLKGDKP